MFLQEPQQMKQFLRAFILVQVEPMREKDVMEELLKMEEVIEAHMITGEYDVLAVVQARRHFLEADYDDLRSHEGKGCDGRALEDGGGHRSTYDNRRVRCSCSSSG